MGGIAKMQNTKHKTNSPVLPPSKSMEYRCPGMLFKEMTIAIGASFASTCQCYFLLHFEGWQFHISDTSRVLNFTTACCKFGLAGLSGANFKATPSKEDTHEHSDANLESGLERGGTPTAPEKLIGPVICEEWIPVEYDILELEQ